IIWPVATLTIGLICGSATFEDEQRTGAARFLGDQRLSLSWIWWTKIVFWICLGTLAGCAAGLVAYPLHLNVNGGAIWQRLATAARAEQIGSATYITAWFAYGFSVSQFFSLTLRKNIVAIVVSALATLFLLGLWLPSIICGNVAAWQLFVPPLLVGTRAGFRSWVSSRLT